VIDKYINNQVREDKGASRTALDTQSALHQMRQMFITIEELNKKLLIAEENKSRFLSLIYNEFNNPLMSITILMKDVIEDKSKTKEEIVESISMVYSDILILNSQLSNILMGADIESTSGISKHLTKFNIQTMIDDIIDIQHVIHREKHLEVEVSLSFPELIYQDRDKYFLIFRNLIDNAFEFSPEASKVSVKGVVEDDTIIFSVSNMGNRIKEPNRMYDAFYHEHSDFSRMHHGLGLGLAIVKHLSNFLGGYVAYSVEEGRHLFTVSLPLDPNTPGITFEDDVSTFIFDDDIENRF
jgi:signal transduction histidine kinase